MILLNDVVIFLAVARKEKYKVGSALVYERLEFVDAVSGTPLGHEKKAYLPPPKSDAGHPPRNHLDRFNRPRNTACLVGLFIQAR